MSEDDDARDAIKRGLERALAAQRRGRLQDIGNGWEAAASFDHEDGTLSLALNFWESWADSAAHGWLYYDGIQEEDWPRMAVDIIAAVEEQRFVTDPDIVKQFAPRSLRLVRWKMGMKRPPHRTHAIAWLLSLFIVSGTMAATLAAAAFWGGVGSGAGLVLLFVLFLVPAVLLDGVSRLSSLVQTGLIRRRQRKGSPPRPDA